MTNRDREYLSYYRKMVTIREFETLAGELCAASKIPGFIHQENPSGGYCTRSLFDHWIRGGTHCQDLGRAVRLPGCPHQDL